VWSSIEWRPIKVYKCSVGGVWIWSGRRWRTKKNTRTRYFMLLMPGEKWHDVKADDKQLNNSAAESENTLTNTSCCWFNVILCLEMSALKGDWLSVLSWIYDEGNNRKWIRSYKKTDYRKHLWMLLCFMQWWLFWMQINLLKCQ